MSDSIRQCAQLIIEAKSIAALTGAGISTNAGIPDFRGPNGLYITKKYDADNIFDIEYFGKNPEPFFDFARDFVNLESGIEPTFTAAEISENSYHGRYTQGSLHKLCDIT